MQTLEIFKALSDELRLRILRAVTMAELSVAELVSTLGLPQSTVSRHLKPLRDAQLVETRREGTSIYYRRGSALADRALAEFVEQSLDQIPSSAEDRASVRRVLDLRKKRSRDFFDKIAGRYGTLTQPGGGWDVLARGLAVGFKDKVIADIGAGEGALSLMLARFARKVYSIDQAPRMLRLVEEQAVEAGVATVLQVVEGDLEHIPLAENTCDAVFLSQALHHAADPSAAVLEASRVLKAEGQLIILDLARHEQEWVREQWADQWLGFEEKELKSWMKEAGLKMECIERHAGSNSDLATLIAIGTKT